jgi:hypothetical protein
MATRRFQILSPTTLLFIFIFISQLIFGFYLSSRIEPPLVYGLLYRFGFIWILYWWLHWDGRKPELTRVLDLGLFLFAGWLIVMPYYLFKTRGERALIPIAAFIGVYFGAMIVGALLSILFLP